MRMIWNKGHRIRASDKNLGRLGSNVKNYGRALTEEEEYGKFEMMQQRCG